MSSREIPKAQNIEFGREIAKLATTTRKNSRVAFVASSDQDHAHFQSEYLDQSDN